MNPRKDNKEMEIKCPAESNVESLNQLLNQIILKTTMYDQNIWSMFKYFKNVITVRSTLSLIFKVHALLLNTLIPSSLWLSDTALEVLLLEGRQLHCPGCLGVQNWFEMFTFQGHLHFREEPKVTLCQTW